MKIQDLIQLSQRPAPYEKGSHFMWTDPYIGKFLLETHLNKEVDLASRLESSIERTMEWILSKCGAASMKVLDLGCGPGLYTQRFARLGHRVTGVDLSENSLNHAKKAAEEEGLDINYIHGSYLEQDLGENAYDLIILIYLDFGVLSPEEQAKVLQKVGRALKPTGQFIFDVMNEASFSEHKESRELELEPQGGFWSPNPYLSLSNYYIYNDEKAMVSQSIVMEDPDTVRTYRFWTQFFTDKHIEILLKENGLLCQGIDRGVLEESNKWNGSNVSFVTAKSKDIQ